MSNLVEFVDGDMTEEDRKKIDELLIKIDEENKLPEKTGKLEAENKRLREALEFYAELDGNGIQLYGYMDSNALEFVDGDSQIFGTIAKDALKGNEK